MEAIFLGIDLGTSSVKAVLVDGGDAVLAESAVPLEVQRPRPGWSEQDPESWWDATLSAVDALRAPAPGALAAAACIGLSGQVHGAVLLGAGDTVLRPAMLWNDGRAAAECEALEFAFPALRDVTGNIAMPGFTAPKLQWVRRHEPALFAATRLVLLPKAYLRLRLCGEAVEDMSDASGTLWLEVAHLARHPRLRARHPAVPSRRRRARRGARSGTAGADGRDRRGPGHRLPTPANRRNDRSRPRAPRSLRCHAHFRAAYPALRDLAL